MIVELQQNDPLVSPLYVTYIGYFPHAEHHYVDRSVPIQQYVLIYCVEGKGHYKVNGKEYDVVADEYFILPAHMPHLYFSEESAPWTIYWVHFDGELAAYYAEGAQTPQRILPGLTSRISHRNSIFEEIFATLASGYTKDSLRYATSAFVYYLASMRYLQQYRKSVPSIALASDATDAHSPMTAEDVVRTATHYLHERIERKLSMESLAAYLGYSVGHTTALFKQVTGQSPLSYFNRMKIEKTCEMLSSTDMKMNQISHKVGIEDSLYFSRLFRKVMGMSPTEYRNKTAKR